MTGPDVDGRLLAAADLIVEVHKPGCETARGLAEVLWKAARVPAGHPGRVWALAAAEVCLAEAEQRLEVADVIA